MIMTRTSFLTCSGLLTCLALTFSVVKGVDIGSLPNLAHGVGGTLEYITTTRIRIRDFTYDGQGPAAFLYYYAPGVEVTPNRFTAQGVTIPIPSPGGDQHGAFKLGRRYSGEDIVIELPSGTDVCDIATLTIWCEAASIFFTRINIPRSTFASDGADPCTFAASPTQATTASTVPAATTPETTPPPATTPDETTPPPAATTIAITPFQPSSVEIGTLPNLEHGIMGTLVYISPTTLKLKNFHYDGQGPAAFLYYYPPGITVTPSNSIAQGVKIPVPGGSSNGAFQLGRRYSGEDITIELKNGTDVCDIATLTVWCEAFSVFFTTIDIPRSTFVSDGADPCRLMAQQPPTTPSPTTMPAPTTMPETVPTATTPPLPIVVEIGTLPTLEHGVMGTLKYLSPTTLKLKNFHYDGQGPAAFLYYYPPNVTVTPLNSVAQGVKIPVPGGDERGAFRRGRPYTGEDVTIELPSGTDVCDIATLTVWCEDFSVFFTRIDIPRSTFVENGADPCRLAGAPVTQPTAGTTSGTSRTPPPTRPTGRPTRPPGPPAPGGHDNCAPLGDSLQLSWTVDRAAQQISYMICGCQSSDPGLSQYMAFGLSGRDSFTFMEGADVTVAWVDSALGPMAQDYHLQEGQRTQCRGGMGVCPDVLDSRGTCTDDVSSISGFSFNRQQCVSYTRPLTSSDGDCDIPIDPDNTQQYIVWAVGGIEETAFRHFKRSGTSTAPLHLGRAPLNECAGQTLTCDSCPAFEALTATAEDGNIFRATIGPSGSDRGYMALTGQAGWGIAWYINGILAPELEVQRGKNYFFIVEGGDDPEEPSNYHPFYITDSISGGRLQNTLEQRGLERVFAGFTSDDIETGIGKLCSSIETSDSIRIRERCGPIEMYTRSLDQDCPVRIPGVVEWTPDENTPDIVYYQCATHRNLGWRIRVVDGGTSVGVDGSISPQDVLDALGLGESSSLPASVLSLPLLLLLSVLALAAVAV